MKIVAISDTHDSLDKVKVPKGDLLIHAGDLTFRGTEEEISKELQELGKKAEKFKYGCVIICGNHDWLGEKNPTLMKKLAEDSGLTYLDHSSIQIAGLNIFGSAYTPAFCDWAFNVYTEQELEDKWAQIPDNTNVLVTHGPPAGIMDIVPRNWTRVGCKALYERVKQLKDLQLHVFGHIHHGYGQLKQGNVLFVNAATCTESYRAINKPIVIEL